MKMKMLTDKSAKERKPSMMQYFATVKTSKQTFHRTVLRDFSRERRINWIKKKKKSP